MLEHKINNILMHWVNTNGGHALIFYIFPFCVSSLAQSKGAAETTDI